MKFLVYAFILAIIASSCSIIETDSKVSEEVDFIEIIYFYQNPVCFPCSQAGLFAEETIQKRFQKENESGVLSFKKIDLEDKEKVNTISKYDVPIGMSGIRIGIYRKDSFESIEYYYEPNLENKEKWMDEFEIYLRNLIKS